MRQRAANALFLAIALLVPARANSQSGAAEEILKQAISRHQAGEIDGAIQAYEKYLAARPDSAMARSNLGAAYARAARYEDAIAQYRHALKLQPANAPVERPGARSSRRAFWKKSIAPRRMSCSLPCCWRIAGWPLG